MFGKEALHCKVVLIGESGVGKTSIINRYISHTFSIIMSGTPCSSFVTKTICIEDYNESIKFEIWDTTGNVKYRALAKVLYQNATGIILVYDITRRNSFEELKNYWIKEIKPVVSPNLSN